MEKESKYIEESGTIGDFIREITAHGLMKKEECDEYFKPANRGTNATRITRKIFETTRLSMMKDLRRS